MRKIDKIVGISLFSLTGLGLAGYLVYNRVKFRMYVRKYDERFS